MLESVLVLAAVRQRFRFEPATDDEALPVPVLTLQPDRPILLALRAVPRPPTSTLRPDPRPHI
jgi:hypothetical protein